MSKRLSKGEILWLQRLWASESFYNGKLDGLWGPQTEQAEQRYTAEARHLRELYGEQDSRTERNILSMSISAQSYARQMHRRIIAAGFDAKIISGTRTFDEQEIIYATGRRGIPGERIISYAKPGHSYHNYGQAWDYALFNGREYIDGDTREELEMYDAMAQTVADWWEPPNSPVRWGGQWTRKDRPHFQLNLGVRATTLVPYFEQGQLYQVLAKAA